MTAADMGKFAVGGVLYLALAYGVGTIIGRAFDRRDARRAEEDRQARRPIQYRNEF